MMFIIPVVIETEESNLPFVLTILRDTAKGEHVGVEFSITGFGNTLPVPATHEGEFREQLNKRKG